MKVVQTVAAPTVTAVNYPLVGALVATEAELGPNRQWVAKNSQQQRLLEYVFAVGRPEVESIPEIKSISSRLHTVVNSFLKSEGFSIELDPFPAVVPPDPPNFGVASVLKLLLEWLRKGEATTVQSLVTFGTYPAVRLEGSGVSICQAGGFRYPIVRLQTKTRDLVYLSVMEGTVEEDEIGALAKKNGQLRGRTLQSLYWRGVSHD